MLIVCYNPPKLQKNREIYMKFSAALATLLFLCGCSAIDPVIVPIERASIDLNETQQNLNFTILPDTHMHMKGSKLAIERKF